MIAATRSRLKGLGLLVAAAFTGCGQEELPVPPTAAQLARLAAETRTPAYWLGPRYEGLSVSHVSTGRDEVTLTYGAWRCDSGCSNSGGVSTRRRGVGRLSRFEYFKTDIDPGECWSRVGKAVAVLLGCNPNGYPQELLIYSGSRAIRVTSLPTRDRRGEVPARTVAHELQPLNHQAPWPLLRPKRLGCRAFEQVDGRYRSQMPSSLRPRSKC
jgi:hypothetical protein